MLALLPAPDPIDVIWHVPFFPLCGTLILIALAILLVGSRIAAALERQSELLEEEPEPLIAETRSDSIPVTIDSDEENRLP